MDIISFWLKKTGILSSRKSVSTTEELHDLDSNETQLKFI